MESVESAIAKISQHLAPLPSVQMPISTALARVLDEDVTSDVDSPPHDKSIVDGYAIHASFIDAPRMRLQVLEEVVAGALPTKSLAPGCATRIMTGAPIPPETAGVVMIEKTQWINGQVQIDDSKISLGQNIARQGSSMRTGEVVLSRGTRLRGIELGLLAEVGCTHPRVIPQVRVAILSTGDELVDPSEKPGAGKLRNSNSALLAGLVEDCGASAHVLGIARDNLESLHHHVAHGLEHDMLLLSGGVSAGVLDLVPQVLEAHGVRCHFHKVSLKPGKPLWFGTKSREGQQSVGPPKLVFGLPGNPVSGLVCFELFVRTAIAVLQGVSVGSIARTNARLSKTHNCRGDRPTFWPGRIHPSDTGETLVEPLSWKGSGDLRTLALSNALICFPAGDATYDAQSSVVVQPLSGS